MTQLATDGCAVRAYITGLKADVLRAPDKNATIGEPWCVVSAGATDPADNLATAK